MLLVLGAMSPFGELAGLSWGLVRPSWGLLVAISVAIGGLAVLIWGLWTGHLEGVGHCWPHLGLFCNNVELTCKRIEANLGSEVQNHEIP